MAWTPVTGGTAQPHRARCTPIGDVELLAGGALRALAANREAIGH